MKQDDPNDDTSSCSTSASADLWSDEIPVWVHNEQRFISGITEDTTCLDLIEAILEDECVVGKPDFTSKSPKDYVITERWKKVEQVLDSKTNILTIWNAWGNAQPEVRFFIKFLSLYWVNLDTFLSSGHVFLNKTLKLGGFHGLTVPPGS